MKKWLLLFVIIDFVFVGLVLKFSTDSERRQVASSDNFGELTEGQQRKLELVKAIDFSISEEGLEFKTDKLQMICETSSTIELKFFAQNMAVAGNPPVISHIYTCSEIKKDLSLNLLATSLKEFKQMHKTNELNLPNSQLKASGIYASEDFPEEWRLSEVTITGPSTFTINQYELDRVFSDHRFEFKLSISEK